MIYSNSDSTVQWRKRTIVLINILDQLTMWRKMNLKLHHTQYKHYIRETADINVQHKAVNP